MFAINHADDGRMRYSLDDIAKRKRLEEVHEHPRRARAVLPVYFEGAVLIEDTWNPEFESCRALVARGVTGRLEVWRADKPYPGLIFPDIEEGARWTVVETTKRAP